MVDSNETFRNTLAGVVEEAEIEATETFIAAARACGIEFEGPLFDDWETLNLAEKTERVKWGKLLVAIGFLNEAEVAFRALLPMKEQVAMGLEGLTLLHDLEAHIMARALEVSILREKLGLSNEPL